jgi:membrane protease YdiL (CAAX protease family)
VNNLKIAAIFYTVTLGVYALVLYLFPNIPLWIPSYVYHVFILFFPLALIIFHGESSRTLGLIWGKWKLGIPAALAVIVISFLVWWFLNSRFTVPRIDQILFSTIIWGPTAEEFLFRGYLQPKLEARTGKWGGLVIASLLFGIAHLPKIFLRQAATPPLVPEAFILGFAFGLIRDRTGSLYYGMLCHMAYNLIVTLV